MVSTHPCEARAIPKESSNFCHAGLLPACLPGPAGCRERQWKGWLQLTPGTRRTCGRLLEECSPGCFCCSSNKRRGNRAACVLLDVGDALSAVVELFGRNADRDVSNCKWTLSTRVSLPFCLSLCCKLAGKTPHKCKKGHWGHPNPNPSSPPKPCPQSPKTLSL